MAEAENFWSHENPDPEFTEQAYHMTDELKDAEFDPDLDGVDDDVVATEITSKMEISHVKLTNFFFCDTFASKVIQDRHTRAK